jgi:hypothetical protein
MMQQKEIPTFTGDGWLRDLLENVAATNACVRWGCTTCGAEPFRNALVQSAQSTGGSSDGLCEIAGQLGRVAVRPEHVDAVRFVIMFLNARASSTTFNEQLLPLFAGSPAATVHRTMLAHHENVMARRRSHEPRNDPTEIKRHRQQRADEARARLAERAQRKSEIDKAWRTREHDTKNKEPFD